MWIINFFASLFLVLIPSAIRAVWTAKKTDKTIWRSLGEKLGSWKKRPVKMILSFSLALAFLTVTAFSAIMAIDSNVNSIRFYTYEADDQLLLQVEINNELGFTEIYYTTDGSNPGTSATAERYNGPFLVQKNSRVIAVRKWSGLTLNENSITCNAYGKVTARTENIIVSKEYLKLIELLDPENLTGLTGEELGRLCPWIFAGMVAAAGGWPADPLAE